MTQHTQGPWVVNGNQIHAANKHETFVSAVFDQNGDAKGNARLIAAAPELLAAAEGMLASFHESAKTELALENFPHLKALSNAITKAKGE